MSSDGQFNIANALVRRLACDGGPFTRRRFGTLMRLVCCWSALLPHAFAAATLVHSPYLQNLQGDHVTIVWSTKENQAATVRYSTDTSFSQSTDAHLSGVFQPAQTGMSTTFYQYQATLTGLSAGTAYSYQIVMAGVNITPETDYRFQTPGPGPFSFLVYGDSGDGSANQLAVAFRLVAEQPNFILHVGDIAYPSGTYQEFTDNHFSVYATLMRRACFFPVAGNHEYYTTNSAPYLALHAPPTAGVDPRDAGRYYSFDWGPVHFVALDANLLDVGFAAQQARMLAWLENDLSATQAPWKVAYWHQNPYPISQHVDDPIDIASRQLLVPILERHGVQVVFCGHEHNYQRSKPMRGGVPVSSGPGTIYMTTGAGGAVLHPISPQSFLDQQAMVWEYLHVDVDGPRFTIHAIGADGKEFDRVQLAPPPTPFLADGNPVVNAASFQPALATGSLVTIFGQGLASGTGQATGLPLPATLAGATVTLNGTPLALNFASPGQINAALPLDAVGPATLRVTTSAGFAETQITIADTAPAIFPSAITHVNGTLVSATAPSAPGETLIIYMTGLGQVDGKLDAGQPAPSAPLLRVLAPVDVQIGNSTDVTPDFVGLTPGFFGLYQVNIKVPQNLAAQIYPLSVSVKGKSSNSQSLQVQLRNP